MPFRRRPELQNVYFGGDSRKGKSENDRVFTAHASLRARLREENGPRQRSRTSATRLTAEVATFDQAD